jgi:outer membrane lipoprotein-sorting protein
MAMNKKLRRTVVAGSAVAGIGLVGTGLYPALASDGGPDLPEVTAEELLVMIAESDTEQLTGTVRMDVGMDIPGLGSVASTFGGPAGRLASLATGSSTLKVAVDGEERQRLAIADGSEEFSVIHNAGDLWMYDSASNTAYHGEVPEDAQHELDAESKGLDKFGLTPQEAAQQILAEANEHADISVSGTAKVAGQSAYQLLVEPKDGEGGVESVRISVDAETGVPLAVTVEGENRQLLDLAFSQIRYEQPSGGNFDFTPPKGADIVDLNTDNPLGGLGLGAGLLGHH